MADVRMLTLQAVREGEMRAAQFMGRPYRVVPAVLVRSQVLNNNLGFSLLPAEEITPEWARAWNAVPVIAGEHPTVQGQPISARDPDLLNTRGVGFIFSAQAEDVTGGRRLKADVWLAEERGPEVTDLPQILADLEAGGAVELSTGFPVILEAQNGNYNGHAYTQIMHPVGVDHLAVFAQGKGACSVTDGCGLGVHRETATSIPGKVQLAEKGEVSMGQHAAGDTGKEVGMLRQLGRAVLKVMRGKTAENADGVSDEDRRAELAGAIREQIAMPNQDPCIEAVYSDQGLVVFWFMGPTGSDPAGDQFYQSKFSENEGKITLERPSMVERHISYLPVTAGNQRAGTGPAQSTQQEEGAMERKALIATLAEAGPLAAEQLEKLSDCQLSALAEAGKGKGLVAAGGTVAPAKTEPGSTVEVAEHKETGPEKDKDAKDPLAEVTAQLKAIGASVTALQAEIKGLKDVTAPAVEEQARERTELVATLAANARVTGAGWTKEQLEGMPIEALHKLAAMARGESYVGRGGPKTAAANTEAAFVEPVKYWEKPAAEKREGVA